MFYLTSYKSYIFCFCFKGFFYKIQISCMSFCCYNNIGIFSDCNLLKSFIIVSNYYIRSFLKTFFCSVFFTIIYNSTFKAKKGCQFQNFFTYMTSTGNNKFFFWNKYSYKSTRFSSTLHL